MHDRQNQAVGMRQGFAVQLAAPDDHDLRAHCEPDSVLQGMCNFAALGRERTVAGHDDVLPPRQDAPNRLPGLAAHDDGLAHRGRLEMPQFTGQVPWHAPVLADGPVAAHGRDDRDDLVLQHRVAIQTAIGARMAG